MIHTTPGYYRRWAAARNLLSTIRTVLAAGGSVTASTYTRTTRYTASHADNFAARPSGLYYVAGGKRRPVCLTGCAFRFWRA